MRMLRIFSLSLSACLFAVAAQAANPPAIYTAGQAAAGAAAYVQNCAMCHSANLAGGGGPALVGPGFASAGTTIGSIFTEPVFFCGAT